MTHVFKHPNYYKELRKRNKAGRIPPTSSGQAAADQAISCIMTERVDGWTSAERAPGPGLKQQAASDKQQAASDKPTEPQASSGKLQASSNKLQAPSHKRQAP